MSRILLLQVIASIGAVLGVACLYVGLTQGSDALAVVGFGLFAVSLLVTPALRLLPVRVSDDDAAGTGQKHGPRDLDTH